MKIQFASDLHLEFQYNRDFVRDNPLKPVGEILILAGDIVPFIEMEKHKWFFKYVSDYFETVYWIPGNHEYYYFDAAEKSGVLDERIRSNVWLVNNKSFFHGDLKLIFSTLWSKITTPFSWYIQLNVSDFKVIKYKGKRLSIIDFNAFHDSSVAFLEKEFSNNNSKNTVIATHHVPTLMNYPPEFRTSDINEAFATELYGLINSSKADYWIYGHHHRSIFEFQIGQTKLITNQLGYVQHGEHRNFSIERVIDM